MKEQLTIIVITCNRLDYTKRTIESLVKTVPNANFIIYDNHSDEDGFEDYLRGLQFAPMKAHIILSDKNRGWGSAVNDALRWPKTEFILVSNNDVIYNDGWFEKCVALYDKYSKIGVLGVWKHRAHGVKQDLGDLIVKDQMPAVGWLLKSSNIEKIGAFPEHGPCLTKGGNGEDVGFCIKTEQAGLWVCGPLEDVAIHIDGY